MLASRKSLILRRFARSVSRYAENAALHRAVAARLTGLVPDRVGETILELGCGPGILTQSLVARFPRAALTVTDVVPAAVAACRESLGPSPNVRFGLLDADDLDLEPRFDLVISSMVLHWLDDAAASLRRQRAGLRPGGYVAFSTIGPDNFREWQSALRETGAPSGLTTSEGLPGIVCEERLPIDYGSAEGFLKMLRDIGADQPRRGYRPLTPRVLKDVCRTYNARFGGVATWHIVYGLIPAAR